MLAETTKMKVDMAQTNENTGYNSGKNEVVPTSPDEACLLPRKGKVKEIVKYIRYEYPNGGKWLNDPDNWGIETRPRLWSSLPAFTGKIPREATG